MKLTILPEDVAKANELLQADAPKLLHCERCIVACAITRQTGKVVATGYSEITRVLPGITLIIPQALRDQMVYWDRRTSDGTGAIGEWELMEIPYVDEVDI